MALYIAEDQQTNQGIKDLLYEDGVIRGWCRKRINGQVLWIGMIQIDPPRQGYGSAFMEIYEEYGRDFGCQMIECEPQGSAIPFWNNIGFINTGPRMMHYPQQLSDSKYKDAIDPYQMKLYVLWALEEGLEELEKLRAEVIFLDIGKSEEYKVSNNDIETFKSEIVDKSKKLYESIDCKSCKEDFNKFEKQKICISCGYNQYCKTD